MTVMTPAGDFRTSYRADTTIFPTLGSRAALLGGAGAGPLRARWCWTATSLSLLINVGTLGIAALGLNILVGFTGQISIGHAAFFGFGAFASAWLHDSFGLPVLLCIPRARA